MMVKMLMQAREADQKTLRINRKQRVAARLDNRLVAKPMLLNQANKNKKVQISSNFHKIYQIKLPVKIYLQTNK